MLEGFDPDFNHLNWWHISNVELEHVLSVHPAVVHNRTVSGCTVFQVEHVTDCVEVGVSHGK